MFRMSIIIELSFLFFMNIDLSEYVLLKLEIYISRAKLEKRIKKVLRKLKKNTDSLIKLALQSLKVNILKNEEERTSIIYVSLILISSTETNLIFGKSFSFLNTILNVSENFMSIDKETLPELKLCKFKDHIEKLKSILGKIVNLYIFMCNSENNFNFRLTKQKRSNQNTLNLLEESASLEQTQTLTYDGSVVNAYDSSISIDVDIDAIFGCFSISNAKYIFKNSISINFCARGSNKIYGKDSIFYYVDKPMHVKDMLAYKIGCVDTSAGKLSLFYVSGSHEKTASSNILYLYLKKAIYNFFEAGNCRRSIKSGSFRSENLSFELKIGDVYNFFEFLDFYKHNFNGHAYDFMYMETFGNKDKLSTF